MRTDAPRLIDRLLSLSNVEMAARVALASPFVIGGIASLVDFEGTMNRLETIGLTLPALFAIGVILAQLVGSVLFLTRQYCGLGAAILAAFTVIAALVVHRFWTFTGPDFVREMMIFFEHAAITGGLVIAGLYGHRSIR